MRERNGWTSIRGRSVTSSTPAAQTHDNNEARVVPAELYAELTEYTNLVRVLRTSRTLDLTSSAPHNTATPTRGHPGRSSTVPSQNGPSMTRSSTWQSRQHVRTQTRCRPQQRATSSSTLAPCSSTSSTSWPIRDPPPRGACRTGSGR
jgi:hypothetical protein